MGWYIITFQRSSFVLVFYLSKKTGFIDGRAGKLLDCQTEMLLPYFYINTAVLMDPARSGFSHSLTLSLTHTHINTNRKKKLLHVVKSLAGKILDMHDYPDPTTTFKQQQQQQISLPRSLSRATY